MSFVGLNREFSYSVLPLAAADPDMTDYYRLRMVNGYADGLSPSRAELLGDYNQLAIREALKIGYQLTNQDVVYAVVKCLDGILQEQGIKTGFSNG